jgi:hypothetical protein
VMAKEHNTLQGNRGLMMRLVEIEATSTQKWHKKRRRSSSHEPSQASGDACVQPRHFEHERQGKRTEWGYPAWQENHTTLRRHTCH